MANDVPSSKCADIRAKVAEMLVAFLRPAFPVRSLMTLNSHTMQKLQNNLISHSFSVNAWVR